MAENLEFLTAKPLKLKLIATLSAPQQKELQQAELQLELFRHRHMK